ncbi:fam-l protein [Plasmodium malariae]|uniref:Fam-l protein n=1 Tax=Plasmodium malariae TaxID=5858 RepID=A0A1D3JH54_PLAMA|nr:fam-l protein [Plasmodium malariae]SBT85468.1 fam-l protein [Plasmodium malariae]
MEKKIKPILLIKFTLFVLLAWICYFTNNANIFSKFFDENYKVVRKLDTNIYRSLAKYKQYKDLNNIGLKNGMQNNGDFINENIYSCEKLAKNKSNLSNDSPSKNSRGHKQDKKNKSCVFETKKYSNLEKNIFKELDYMDFLKENRTISNKNYRKIICKKYGLRFALPVLILLLLLTVFIVDLTLGIVQEQSLWALIGFDKAQLKKLVEPLGFILTPLSKLSGFFKHSTWGGMDECSSCKDAANAVSKECILGQLFGYLVYVIPFFILGVAVISKVIYYHKKVKKYEKIKFRKR